jgi:hypothetical protein
MTRSRILTHSQQHTRGCSCSNSTAAFQAERQHTLTNDSERQVVNVGAMKTVMAHSRRKCQHVATQV